MPVSNTLLERLSALEAPIKAYQAKAKKLGEHASINAQQLKKLQALYNAIQAAKATQTEQQPQEDDWLTLVDRSKLPEESKQLLKAFLKDKPDQEQAKAYVILVTKFYQQRYTNHLKHLEKLDLGIDISEEQYLAFLKKAIAYTIEKKGLNASSQDFALHLILLLKGRLKDVPNKEGEMQLTLGHQTTKGTQLEIAVGE